jgi:hypothetical protein
MEAGGLKMLRRSCKASHDPEHKEKMRKEK